MKKILLYTVLIFGFINIINFGSRSEAKMIFAYHRLAMKDLEQMDRYLRAKIVESQKSQSEQIPHLIEATLTLFSRPNLDNMIEKLTPTLLAELNSYELTGVVFNKFVEDALVAIKDETKDTPSDAQVTYLIALENWMVEMKSRLDNREIYQAFEKVAQGKAKISKLAKISADLHIPYPLVEPSEYAQKILNEYNEAVKSKEETSALGKRGQRIQEKWNQKKKKEK